MATPKPSFLNRAGVHQTQPGGFRAFIPQPLPPDPPLRTDEALLALLCAADREVGRLEGSIQILPNPDLFLFMFVRREAVLSSQIEGTESSLRDLLQAEARIRDPHRPADVAEVSNYVAALSHGIAALDQQSITVGLILSVHEKLMHGVRGGKLLPGELRPDQVWIGPRNAPITEATFVPPPANAVARALENLVTYIGALDATPSLIRAGFAHAQFETIHPFLDGSGRVGRLLISLILADQDILTRPALNLSYHFKQHRSSYYDALQAVRDEGDWEGWLKFFLQGVVQSANECRHTARRVVDMREQFRQLALTRLGRAATNGIRLLETLFHRPIVDASHTAKGLEISYAAANRLIDAFVREGVLEEITGNTRNRRFAFQPYIELFTD